MHKMSSLIKIKINWVSFINHKDKYSLVNWIKLLNEKIFFSEV